jgi:hypothetical protein
LDILASTLFSHSSFRPKTLFCPPTYAVWLWPTASSRRLALLNGDDIMRIALIHKLPAIILPVMAILFVWATGMEATLAATYHVNQSAANAADINPGTEEAPWKTVSRAAATCPITATPAWAWASAMTA